MNSYLYSTADISDPLSADHYVTINFLPIGAHSFFHNKMICNWKTSNKNRKNNPASRTNCHSQKPEAEPMHNTNWFFFFKHITINCCPTLIFNLANSDPYLYSHLVSVIFIWKIQLVRTFNISIEFFCSLWIQILATLLKEATKSQQKGNLFDVRIMM